MSLIDITRTGPIWQLQMARPPVNALNPALCLALADAVEQAVAEGAGGIILAGGAKVFSAGLDVPYLLSLGDDQEALLQAWSAFFRAARALAASPVPVVAAIAGHAPAGGCVLALCCDYRIMANGPFRIGLNETQVGLVAPEGIQALLVRVVGPHRAERLLVAGAMPEADEALRIGLWTNSPISTRSTPAPMPGCRHCWICRPCRCAKPAPSPAATWWPRWLRNASTWSGSSRNGGTRTPRPRCAPCWRGSENKRYRGPTGRSQQAAPDR
jgi:hypothetical protein